MLWNVPVRSNERYHAGGNVSNRIHIQQFSCDVWQNGRVKLLFQSVPPLYTNTEYKSTGVFFKTSLFYLTGQGRRS